MEEDDIEKKRKKRATILIIFSVIALAILLVVYRVNSLPNISEKDVKCIGDNSILYTQEGCIYCDYQLEIFKDKKDLLTIVDCTEVDWCLNAGITETPTWQVEESLYPGTYKIDELKALTGCFEQTPITGVI